MTLEEAFDYIDEFLWSEAKSVLKLATVGERLAVRNVLERNPLFKVNRS